MQVAELPKTMETKTFGRFGGPVPADSFQTKRVVVANLDRIEVMSC
jgi:hypothetical protein